MRRDPSRWQSRFARWVRDYTVRGLVRDLDREGISITGQAVYSWISREAIPRPRVASTIVRISRGSIRLTDIYQPPPRPRAARPRVTR